MDAGASKQRSQEPARVRGFDWLVRAGIFAPWVWYASVYLVWLVAWLTLGRRPRPLLDDPKHLGGWVDVAQTLSVGLFLLSFACFGAGFVVTILLGFLRRTTWQSAFLRLGALLLSWILAVGFGRLNLGYVVAWYVD